MIIQSLKGGEVEMFGVKRGITSKTGGLYGERMLFYFMHYHPQLANLPIIPLTKWLTMCQSYYATPLHSRISNAK
jgi:hypothetical protein